MTTSNLNPAGYAASRVTHTATRSTATTPGSVPRGAPVHGGIRLATCAATATPRCSSDVSLAAPTGKGTHVGAGGVWGVAGQLEEQLFEAGALRWRQVGEGDAGGLSDAADDGALALPSPLA